jgi:predicted Zn-dependent peptidase
MALPAPPPLLSKAELARWEVMPPIGLVPEARLPFTPVRTRLKNGLGVTVVTLNNAAWTSIALRVPAMRDTSEGPVEVMAEALRAGTRLPDGQVLLNPKIGGREIYVGTTPDGTTFRWDVMPRASEQALRVLSAFVVAPAFDDVEVDVQRRLALARIAHISDRGEHIDDLALGMIPGFARSTPKEDATRLLELNSSRLRQIHACTARPEDADLVVVGPLSVEAVTAQAERDFGAWQSAASHERCEWPTPVPTAPEGEKPARLARTELQVLFGSGDPYITIAIDGPAPESDDFLPFALLAEILQTRHAGSAKRLRHAGSTYGIHSRVVRGAPTREAILISGTLEMDVAQEALRALVQDISDLPRVLGEDEVEKAKRKWHNSLVNSFASNASVASMIVSQFARKKDIAALPNVPNDIMSIDVARCRDVAQRWFVESHPSIVVVTGKPRTFLRGLGVDAHVQLKYFSSR